MRTALLITIALVGVAIGSQTANVMGWFEQSTKAHSKVTGSSSSAPTPGRPNFDALSKQVDSLISTSGASAGVELVELGGPQPTSWSNQADQPFTAASTYKLPLLMQEAQLISSGRASISDLLCYQSDDWEDGWFTDYQDGSCFTRGELDQRVAHYSDNTAAHILVRVDGGSDELNAYATKLGTHESGFFDPNLTTASDLARLWQAEVSGQAGGAAAQAYLYPLLTNTEFESGIPAGVPAGTQVVHKVGFIDGVVNDAALVNSPHGSYILTICTDSQGEEAEWPLVAAISQDVWNYEVTR